MKEKITPQKKIINITSMVMIISKIEVEVETIIIMMDIIVKEMVITDPDINLNYY